ncbi:MULTISPECIES: hypothetical protein [unclassified Mesorhizobium]|uniref:hypothetical protein n=1 Tax=unclassified Mesorhizobium TaxID=325217 RepID=UPI000417FCE8|nr:MULTISPECIES: hypothetical protein [unclassified Mesorhizobium]WJI75403.1 hypothetical protein NLY37_01310 [Mesorhizobium sp. C395A]
MTIVSLFKILAAAGLRPDRYDGMHGGDVIDWVTDPLSHPVLDTMSERELGDIPFRLTARRTAYETGALGCG